MANSAIIDLIIANVADMLTYMMPIIGLLSGIIFIVSFFLYVTIGLGRRVFRG